MVVNGAGDAVVGLDVHLGKSVFFVDGSFSQITDGGSFNHITDDEAADSLVLGDEAMAVDATNGLNVTASLL